MNHYPHGGISSHHHPEKWLVHIFFFFFLSMVYVLGATCRALVCSCTYNDRSSPTCQFLFTTFHSCS